MIDTKGKNNLYKANVCLAVCWKSIIAPLSSPRVACIAREEKIESLGCK